MFLHVLGLCMALPPPRETIPTNVISVLPGRGGLAIPGQPGQPGFPRCELGRTR